MNAASKEYLYPVDPVFSDPYNQALTELLAHGVDGKTFFYEDRKEALRALLLQAPTDDALGSALLRCQWEVDAAFSLEAAREAGLPPTHWDRYLATLLFRVPNEVFACFGRGLLAIPDAQEVLLRLGTRMTPHRVAAYLPHSSISEDQESLLVGTWAEDHPMIFAMTSAAYLEQRHGRPSVEVWQQKAKERLALMTRWSNEEVVFHGGIECTRDYSDHVVLRSELGLLRAKGYEALLAEQLPSKPAITQALKLAGTEYDERAEQEVKRWFGGLVYARGDIDRCTPAERYMVGYLAFTRWSNGDLLPQHFLKGLEFKGKLSMMDTRVLVEEVLTTHGEARKDHESRLLVELEGLPHALNTPCIDAEDRAWSREVMQFLYGSIRDGIHPQDLYIVESRLSELLEFALLRNVALPEPAWREMLHIAPKRVFFPHLIEHDTLRHPLDRLPRRRQAEALRAWLKTIHTSLEAQGPTTIHFHAIAMVRQAFVRAELEDQSAGFVRTEMIRIMRKVFPEDVSEAALWEIFCSLDTWFPGRIPTGFDTVQGFRLLYGIRHESPEAVRRFIHVVGDPVRLKHVSPQQVGHRWHTLLGDPSCRRLIECGELALEYLRSGTELEQLREKAELWNQWTNRRLYDRTRFSGKYSDHRPVLKSEDRLRELDGNRLGVRISLVTECTPSAAKNIIERYHLRKYPEGVLLESSRLVELLAFIKEHEHRLKGISDRAEYQLRHPLFRYIFLAESFELALQQVEVMLDEFDAPGTEADRLSAFLVHLLDGEDKARVLSGVRFTINGAETPGPSVTIPELQNALKQRLQAVLNPPPESVITAYKRNEQFQRLSTKEGPVLPEGTLLHWSTIDALASILTQGNICGESLGRSAKLDSFPFHVDALSITSVEAGLSLAKVMDLKQFWYMELPIALVYPYRHHSDAFAQGEDYHPASGYYSHKLVFGGLPKTEVGAVVIHKSAYTNQLLTSVQQAIVKGGVYIPVFLSTGEACFTPEHFTETYLQERPYGTIAEFLEDRTWMEGMDIPQNGTHEFTLKEHLLRAESYAREYAQAFGLDPVSTRIAVVAARLHDVGKVSDDPQGLSNPAVADQLLSKIRHISREEARSIRRLIHHDELLGKILQGLSLENGRYHLSKTGEQEKDRFEMIFPTENDKRMLLTLYLADVRAIGSGKFLEWQVEEKLRWLGLLPG